MKIRAIWRDTVIADSEETVVVEGNHYFPPASVRQELLRPSDHRSVCPWKGTAHYYDLVVGDEVNPHAVWYYPETTPEAAHVRGRLAFWGGITVGPA